MSSCEVQNKKSRPINGYNGFCVFDDARIAVSADENAFYADFIEKRKPAVLKHKLPIDIAEFRLSNIESRLNYEKPLQVERKHAYGFGLGTKRELKTFSQIVEKLRQGDDTYYLTTQYEAESSDDENDDNFDSEEESDIEETMDGAIPASIEFPSLEVDSSGDSDFPDDFDGVDDFDALDDLEVNDGTENYSTEEADGAGDDSTDYVVPEHKLTEGDALNRVKTLLQPPLTNAVYYGDFPMVPDQFKPLITQQINLWMGCAAASQKPDLKNPTIESLGKYVPRGNSSGLHHDHADNLYVLVQGAKRFTLYLPADADKLCTVGKIKQVYSNGLIDYCVDKNAPHWRPLRADGAILSDWAEWRLEQKGVSKIDRSKLTKVIQDEENARLAILKERSSKNVQKDGKNVVSEEDEFKMDPPSFSRVPPILAHLDEVVDDDERKGLEAFAEREFPGFLRLKKMEVLLKPGDMLYLPAGWFHEVTSFGDEASPQHVALNWWFVPPTGTDAQPYEDAYWTEDFQATLAALEWVKSEHATENE